MKRFLACLFLLLGLSPSFAQFNGASGIYALNGQTFGLTSTWLKIVSGGSGYAPGDTISLTCPAIGAANKTPGTVTVATVSSGAVTSINIATPGIYTALPSSGDASAINGVCAFVQASTSGSGSGAVISTLLSFLGTVNLNASSFLTRTNFIVADSIDLTGATDVSTALQALITANPTKRIYVPAGTPLINNMVTLGPGQTLQCEGRTQTVFQVNSGASGYNLTAANGVFALGNTTLGASIFDCGITFTQPNFSGMTRSSIIQYPPALYAVGMPRFQIDRVRISNAWTCLNATGQTGGSYIGRLECGGFNNTTGTIQFNGATDFVHITSIECWPYGSVSDAGGTLLPYLASLYIDQTGVCASFGRVDGLSISKLATFTTSVVFTSAGLINGVPYLIDDLQLDGDGAIYSDASPANVLVGNFYSTKDSAAIGNSVAVQTAGQTVISNVDIIDSSGNGSIYITGGLFVINGGSIIHTATAQPAAYVVSTGTLEINNVYSNPTFTGTVARTQPFYLQNGASSCMILNGNTAPAAGASTGNMFAYINDNVCNYAANNNFSGWSPFFGATTAIGYYDINEPIALTVTPAFQTNGNFSPTSVTTTGEFYRKGAFADLSFVTTFTTNAYTTASGAFELQVSAPSSVDPFAPCTLFGLGKATFSGMVSPNIQATNIFLSNPTSGNALGYLGTAAFPASTAGVQVYVACHYRVR